MNSRTSCAQRQAPAFLAAHSSASSREGTSTTQNPPMASGYGPSVSVPSVATMLAFWCSSPPAKTHAGVHGLLDHLVCGPGHGRHVLVWDVVHRVRIERDQVSRHLMAPCPGGLLRPHAVETDTPRKTHRLLSDPAPLLGPFPVVFGRRLWTALRP